jgi:hypothetical protein
MGIFGSAPFVDQITHIFRGPEFTPHSFELGKNAVTIKGAESHFQAPFTRDSVTNERKWQAPVGLRSREVTLHEGDAPILHDGRMYGLARNEHGELKLDVKAADLTTRVKHTLSSPSVIGRIAGTAALGVTIDAGVATAVSEHAKKHQKKLDDAKYAQSSAPPDMKTDGSAPSAAMNYGIPGAVLAPSTFQTVY